MAKITKQQIIEGLKEGRIRDKQSLIDFINAKELEELLKVERGPAGPKGDKGDKGDPGRDGRDGRDGRNGQDAQPLDIQEAISLIENELPQLGTEIRNGLELLTGDERLDKSAIKGLEEIEQLARTPKGGGGGSTARYFYQLIDGATYQGKASQYLRANSAGTGLEFTDLASGISATVVHGATADTARPTGYASVMWMGSVEPTNAENNDVWIDTA